MIDEDLYVLPGAVSVSDRAVDIVRQFAGDVKKSGMKAYTIWCFDWASAQSIRMSKDGPDIDLGPGLMLGGAKASEVPKRLLHTVQGVTFAVKIPPDVLAAAREKLIDVEDSDGPIKEKIVLR